MAFCPEKYEHYDKIALHLYVSFYRLYIPINGLKMSNWFNEFKQWGWPKVSRLTRGELPVLTARIYRVPCGTCIWSNHESPIKVPYGSSSCAPNVRIGLRPVLNRIKSWHFHGRQNILCDDGMNVIQIHRTWSI